MQKILQQKFHAKIIKSKETFKNEFSLNIKWQKEEFSSIFVNSESFQKA